MRYQVVPHDPVWKQQYAHEAELITSALNDMAAKLHHIGSTAIPNIAAKPIIDILIAHPAAAQAYGALKERLVRQYPDDFEAYMDGKDAFIKEHEALAVTWSRGR